VWSVCAGPIMSVLERGVGVHQFIQKSNYALEIMTKNIDWKS